MTNTLSYLNKHILKNIDGSIKSIFAPPIGQRINYKIQNPRLFPVIIRLCVSQTYA